MSGYSLHIGLNYVDPFEYDGWGGHLDFATNDAEAMQEIAQNLYYSHKDLLNEKATRNNVIDTLTNFSQISMEGDIILLTYSGHGSYIPDQNGDESSKEDQTWCLYDGQLVDDELNTVFSFFKKGVRILVISDSCHSGSVTREYIHAFKIELESYEKKWILKPKSMPNRIIEGVRQMNLGFYQKIKNAQRTDLAAVKASVKLISACQDNQEAHELNASGVDGRHGRFTLSLIQIWDGGNFKGDYIEFHRRLVSIHPGCQTPNLYNTGQQNPKFDKQIPFMI